MSEIPLPVQIEEITTFCKRLEVTEFAIFGSSLRQNINAHSDIDVLITLAGSAEITLFDLAQIQVELERIYDRPVDLVEKAALRDPYRRAEILRTAQLVDAGHWRSSQTYLG